MQAMAPKRKPEWACCCGKAFPTTSQLLNHQANSKRKACKSLYAQPPVPVVHKRQRQPEQQRSVTEQEAAGRAVSQHLPQVQASRCDLLDALFDEQQRPYAEQLLDDGVQPCDSGQQPSQAELTVGSPVASASRPDVAAHDAPADSSHTVASADHAKPDTTTAAGTPAAAVVLGDPETPSLPTPREGAASHISETSPWAEDMFEVFKPRGWDFSQANLALIMKDMPGAQRTALLSLLRHGRFQAPQHHGALGIQQSIHGRAGLISGVALVPFSTSSAWEQRARHARLTPCAMACRPSERRW